MSTTGRLMDRQINIKITLMEILGIIRSIAIHLSLIPESLQGFSVFKYNLKKGKIRYNQEETIEFLNLWS